MTIAPKAPATSFCDLGALTMGSKIGGSGMSALEPAGDFEPHQRGWPGQIPAGYHEVDVLELSRCAQVRHEVRDRGGRERRPGDLELSASLLESGDPEIAGDDAGEGLQELNRPPLRLGDRLDDLDPLAQLVRELLDLGLLPDLRLQGRQVSLRPVDVGGKARLGAHQDPEVPADHEQQPEVDHPEQPRHVEGGEAEAESSPADPPATPFGREVDPDHFCLSPGRRSARPTATASAGPAACTSSAKAGSISMRWNGFVNSTGMPQFDDR